MKMKNEVMEINGITYHLKIYYERRNATRASISRKSIIIRIPLFLNREEQFKQVLQMKAWARKKLEEHPERFKPKIEKEYKHGDTLNIGNEEYALNIILKDKDSSSASIVGNIVYLYITSRLPEEQQKKHIATLLSRCIAKKRIPQLKKRIDEINTKYFNQKINKIFFKNMSSRWGSCSEHRNINISTRLLFAPDDALTYVCIHELAHLIEMNHSEKFWRLVENAMPDYKEKQKWLKENGESYGF